MFKKSESFFFLPHCFQHTLLKRKKERKKEKKDLFSDFFVDDLFKLNQVLFHQCLLKNALFTKKKKKKKKKKTPTKQKNLNRKQFLISCFFSFLTIIHCVHLLFFLFCLPSPSSPNY